MATAKKTKAGNWCIQVYVGTDANGKKLQKRFYGETKREAEIKATQFLAKKHHDDLPQYKTVRVVIEEYIESKSNVLSPSTIFNYRSILKNLPNSFTSLPLNIVDLKEVQSAINAYAVGRSPKSTRNASALITSSFKQAALDISLNVSLPQKIKSDMRIPTEEEVRLILDYVKDSHYEVPVVLAAYMGLRRSEICALKWADVDFEKNVLHIHSAVVFGEDGLEEKTTKSVSGDRFLSMPVPVVDALMRSDKNGENVCKLNPHTITNRFKEKAVAVGVEPFNFHALRHFYASVMLSLNIPNKYAQRRMGHATDHMLKNVYQHLMQAKIDETDRMIDEYFSPTIPH